MAEVCERIIWSGGGAEAYWGEVIVKERRGPSQSDIWGSGTPGRNSCDSFAY